MSFRGKLLGIAASLAAIVGTGYTVLAPAPGNRTIEAHDINVTSYGQHGGITAGQVVGAMPDSSTALAQAEQAAPWAPGVGSTDPGPVTIGKSITVGASPGSGAIIGEDVAVSAMPGQTGPVIGEQITVGASPNSAGSVVGQRIVIEAGPGAHGPIIGKRVTVTVGPRAGQ